MKNKRWLQYITNVHRIHHITWGYGYTFRPIGIGYFKNHGFQKIKNTEFHNCTVTGVY